MSYSYNYSGSSVNTQFGNYSSPYYYASSNMSGSYTGSYGNSSQSGSYAFSQVQVGSTVYQYGYAQTTGDLGSGFKSFANTYTDYAQLNSKTLSEINSLTWSNTRPDADGYITISEANNWYANGNGQPLYADLSKINFGRISANDFNGIGNSKPFNLSSPSYISNINDGLVYGNITLTLNEGGFGKFMTPTLGYDNYNFDIKPWTYSNIPRNIATYIGGSFAGGGQPYKIYLSGAAPIK